MPVSSALMALPGYVHSTIGLALAAAEAMIVLVTGLTLLMLVLVVVLHGSDETREHLFRFLRWAANRPQPPAPSEAHAATGHTEGGMKRDIPG